MTRSHWVVLAAALLLTAALTGCPDATPSDRVCEGGETNLCYCTDGSRG